MLIFLFTYWEAENPSTPRTRQGRGTERYPVGHHGRLKNPPKCDSSRKGCSPSGQTRISSTPRRHVRGRQRARLLVRHEFSGGIETGEIANFSHHRNGHGELHATQRLKGFNHRVQAPRLHVILQCLIEMLESFGMLIDGTDICLKDDLLGWCRADHFREPPEMSRAQFARPV